MRWLFVKAEETADLIIFWYGFESDVTDGVIVYDKRTKKHKVIRPCSNDSCSNGRIQRTETQFFKVVREEFPDRRWVITG